MSPLVSTPRFILCSSEPKIAFEVGIGIAIALREKKIAVASCITGSGLHSAVTFKRLTRRNVGILDPHSLNSSEMISTLALTSRGADLIFIVGNPEMAQMLGAPIVWVQKSADQHLPQGISGLISLEVKSDRSPVSKIPYLGHLNLDGQVLDGTDSEFSEQNSAGILNMQRLISLGKAVMGSLDLELLENIAKKAAHREYPEKFSQLHARCVRIAVADDSCFNLSYQTNFDLLNYFGAELVPFSPVADEKLPDRIGAVFFPGASLTSYSHELKHNDSMVASLKSFAERGGIIYSEGSGTAYLARSYESDGMIYSGIGILPADMRRREERVSPAILEISEDSILGEAGISLKGLGLNNWSITGTEVNTLYPSARLSYAEGQRAFDGFAPLPQVFLSMTYLNFMSCPDVALSLVQSASVAAKSL